MSHTLHSNSTRDWSIIHCQIRIKKQMLWMTWFSLIYSMANRQCRLWAGIFVVNPALKLKTAHAHRRYLYARECCRRKTSGQCCSNAGPRSSMVTYIGLASVWRLVVSCANPVLHPDLTHSVLLCSYPAGCGGYSFTSYLSQFVQGSSQIEKHVFFLTLIRLIFC